MKQTTSQIEYKLQQNDERVATIKKEMDALTDEEWLLFADSIYSETLCTVYEYALDRANEERELTNDFYF